MSFRIGTAIPDNRLIELVDNFYKSNEKVNLNNSNNLNELDFNLNLHRKLDKQIARSSIEFLCYSSPNIFEDHAIKLDTITELVDYDLYKRTGFCDKLELFNFGILNENSASYRNAYVVVVPDINTKKDIPVGYIKLKGEESFTSWINTYDDGVGLIFGGVYKIPKSIDTVIKKAPEKNEWGIIKLDSFNPKLKRIIHSKTNDGVLRSDLYSMLINEREEFESKTNYNKSINVSLG